MSAIAIKARHIVRAAAGPIRPGETVKAQLRRAVRMRGCRDGNWRVRAARYGEAGRWSAAALDDSRERERAWNARQDRETRAELALATSRLAALGEALERAGAQVWWIAHRDVDPFAVERVAAVDLPTVETFGFADLPMSKGAAA